MAIDAGRNPFRASRLDRLAYRPRGTDWPALRERLDALGWRAAVVGPHGAGKTTLLETLARQLRAEGRPVRRLQVGCHTRWRELRAAFAELPAEAVAICDGAGHLGAWRLGRLRRLTAGRALLITAHRRPWTLPILIELRPDTALLTELVAELAPQLTVDCAALFARHRGNLRSCLLELYDRAAGRAGG